MNSKAMTSLNIDKLADFARGAAFLGAGGGGDPYLGYLTLSQQMQANGPLRIVQPSELNDDDFIVPVGLMGAPTVVTEKLPSLRALEKSLRVLEEVTGKAVTAIIPMEIGGINATIPLALASKLGLPVVNGDGMGRAFPEIHMVTFGVYGCEISPVVLSNANGDVVIVKTEDNKRGENLSRSVVTQMGGQAQISFCPMSGVDVKRTCVKNTLSLALDIGLSISPDSRAPFDSLAKTLSASTPPRAFHVLCDAKVMDVFRETKGGFVRGIAKMQDIAGKGDSFEVHFQNEYIVAYKNKDFLAMVPDIIAILDRETAEPVTSEKIRYGQRVKVVAVSVPEEMTSREALLVFGPRAFGLSTEYRPLHELAE